MFSNTDRLAILAAAQEKNIGEVSGLLDRNADLIKAKTTSQGLSLLHFAAENDDKVLCEFLLEKGHAINPVALNGLTPYQKTNSAEIKEMLSEAHCNALCDKYFSASDISLPDLPYISAFEEDIEILDKDELSKEAAGVENLADGTTYALTYISRIEGNESSYRLVTLFREDMLMLPYYGDMMVIHENEQVKQLKEFLAQANSASLFDEIVKANISQMEARAFMTTAARGIELFPFLVEPLKDSDAPEVQEVKKMFIANTLYAGLMTHLSECTSEQQNNLRELPYFTETITHSSKVITNKNHAAIQALWEELKAKYNPEQQAITLRR